MSSRPPTPAGLITGATGFAGRHLLESLLGDDLRVHAWSNARGRPVDPALASDPRIDWRAVDLLDRASIHSALEAARPAIIYHCAGFADDHRSWQDPVRALSANVLATHNLLETARTLALEARVVVPGSALIYRPSNDPITEDSPIGPTSPYGLSKLAQEMTAAQSPLPVLLARPFNHAGPRQDTMYVTSAFARQLAEVEAGTAEPVVLVGNLDARRDLTDVRDTVRAYRALAERGHPHRPYNVCSGRAYRIGELLDILLSLARVRVAIEVDPARLRPSDNPVVLGSPARISDETGWQPTIPVERTLADLLAFWRAAVAENQSARR
jgi:GDP-4-dehydro-6-deoxy-D-mannose reductase